MADNDALISQFSDVTGVEAERARFFLESSAWQLEVALASFYENDGDHSPALGMPNLDDDEPEFVDEIPVSLSRADVHPAKAPKSKPPSARNTRFGTVASLNQQTNSGSSDEEEGQAFYAGGSRTSGQQVLGPPSKKKDIVSEMFKSVQEHGAEIVDPRNPGAGRGPPSSFAGTGYRLGQSNNDTEVVGVPSAARAEPQTEVVLKLWKTGFSINDGQIRPFAETANREFLECVRRGEVPQELIREARGEEVHLSMEDHRHEEYVAPKTQRSAFTGKGNMLGSPSPSTIGLPQPVTVTVADQEGNEAQARETVPLDQTLPTTTLQIRLVDGSRLIGRFNTSNTIADIRRYITVARPQYQHQTFALMTTFPSKELNDGEQTIDQAGILNAALLQRLK